MIERMAICKICGAEFQTRGNNAKHCAACAKECSRESHRRYMTSEKGKAFRARYREDSNVKETERAWREANPDKVKGYHRKYHETHKEIMHERDKRYYQEHREEILSKQRLERAAKRNLPGAKLAYAKATGKLTYCERMRVTMYPLPCGTRGECRGCVHCPAGAACGNDGHYRWDMESLNGGRSWR